MIPPSPVPAEPPRILLVLRGDDLGEEPCLPAQLQAAGGTLSVDLLLLEPPPAPRIAALQSLLGPHGRAFAAPASAQHVAQIQALEAHLQRHAYDAILLNTLSLAHLRNAPSAPPSTLIALDAMPASQTSGIPEYQTHLWLSQARLILSSHFGTYAHLAGLFPGRTVYTPPAMPNAPRASDSRAAERIVLTGTRSLGDADGLRWFLTQIWPCFHRADCELHVAGSVGETLGCPYPNTRLRGCLADEAAFLRSAHIAIEPVFHGGVSPARLARYLSHGIPSILTQEAASALPGGAGEAYLVATSRAAFIDHLGRLIEDHALRQRLSEAAHHFSRRHFSAGASHQAIATMLRLAPSHAHEDPAR